MRSNPR